MVRTSAAPCLLRLLPHMWALRISHLSTPWLIHPTSLVHASHTLMHTAISGHISITSSSSSTHHLSLPSLVSPGGVTTPIPRLLLRPLLLLHHLRLLILTLLLLLLRVKCLWLLLRYAALLPRRWAALISTSHLVSSKFVSRKSWHLIHLTSTSSIIHVSSHIPLGVSSSGAATNRSCSHSILISHITLSLVSHVSLRWFPILPGLLFIAPGVLLL